MKRLGLGVAALAAAAVVVPVTAAQDVTQPPEAPGTATTAAAVQAPQFRSGTALLNEGSALRVQLDHGYPLKVGTRVEGHLIAPVYKIDHIVLPVNTRVSGIIRSKHPIDGRARANALLNGDFTPLAVPDITFDTLQMANGISLPIRTEVRQRTVKAVLATPAGKRSLKQVAADAIRQRRQDLTETIAAPGKGDRFRRYVYGQLPYHPQRIWIGTQYDADLTEALSVPDSMQPLPVVALGRKAPAGTVSVRLTTPLTSASTQRGATVEAVVSQPLLDASGKQVLLPEGTRISGSVVQVKPAAWFGRGGQLRFNFRNLQPVQDAPQNTQRLTARTESGSQPAGNTKATHGQLTAAEATAGQNMSIDAEGGAKAAPDKNKYLAPAILGILAASSLDRDRDREGLALKDGVVSNGFGLAARVWTMASGDRNVASGFAYFALFKSVYRHWIAKGQETVFPRDTVLQIQIASR